ncbi:hypothetical protein PF005_g30520 [Phytophthora fragariae]|uniref:Uncharacterized protein n=1 Tax=Phytophthora fragariae TaxID=53985 RepID=A0A6A3VB48_9STRA|nr:hypothetical protein PF003_g8845 [Phytophthora fragariae]KAE9163258.1 hypothetical protein PF005_g30520 [Phytophthora fragariae]
MLTTLGLARARPIGAIDEFLELAWEAAVPAVRPLLVGAALGATAVAHTATHEPETRITAVAVARNEASNALRHDRRAGGWAPA